MRNTAKITTAVLAAGTLTLGLSACGSDSGSADENGPLVVAASSVPHAEILNYVKDNLAAKDGPRAGGQGVHRLRDAEHGHRER